jgi:homoserine kinase type II
MMELEELEELRNIVEKLVTNAQNLQEAIDKNYMEDHLAVILSENYDIGELAGVKKLDRGYVNVSYEIETRKNGKKTKYFLRRYKKGIREEEVRFEHSIVKHLMKKHFDLAADIIFKKDGGSYVKEVMKKNGEERYFAIFQYLEGEDKYTWDNPACSMKELQDSARVLARYHDAVSDLKPEGRRYESTINELLPTLSGNLMKYAKRTGNTKFDNYFLNHLDYIHGVIDHTREQMAGIDYSRLPLVAAHCDFHPGNLKYKGKKAVGVFDFDWSKIDVRCFDVGLALTYFCTNWEGKRDGEVFVDRMSAFLRSYQEEIKKLPSLGAFDENEIHYLPLMIKASNLYVLNWDLDDYYIKKSNPFEYLIYLQHNVRVMGWIELNWKRLTDTVYAVFNT